MDNAIINRSVVIKSVGNDDMAQSIAAAMANAAVRRENADLRRALNSIRLENKWLQTRLMLKRGTVDEVYYSRLAQYRAANNKIRRRREAVKRFINLFVTRELDDCER